MPGSSTFAHFWRHRPHTPKSLSQITSKDDVKTHQITRWPPVNHSFVTEFPFSVKHSEDKSPLCSAFPKLSPRRLRLNGGKFSFLKKKGNYVLRSCNWRSLASFLWDVQLPSYPLNHTGGGEDLAFKMLLDEWKRANHRGTKFSHTENFKGSFLKRKTYSNHCGLCGLAFV